MWLPWKSGSAQELLSYTSTGEMSPARNWMIGCRPKKKSRPPRKSSGNGIRADPREGDGGRCSITAMFATSLGRSSTDGPPSECGRPRHVYGLGGFLILLFHLDIFVQSGRAHVCTPVTL